MDALSAIALGAVGLGVVLVLIFLAFVLPTPYQFFLSKKIINIKTGKPLSNNNYKFPVGDLAASTHEAVREGESAGERNGVWGGKGGDEMRGKVTALLNILSSFTLSPHSLSPLSQSSSSARSIEGFREGRVCASALGAGRGLWLVRGVEGRE